MARVDPRPEGSNLRVDWFDRGDVSKLANTFREFIKIRYAAVVAICEVARKHIFA